MIPKLHTRTRIAGGVSIALTALLTAGFLSFQYSQPAQSANTEKPTTPIVRGELQSDTKVPSRLTHAQSRTLNATGNGILTEIPSPGSDLAIGSTLYRINNRPVFLFRGSIPAWRSFESGMERGPDITQLENTLRELGFLEREAQDKFLSSTAQAIRAWQKATGQEQTGRIDFENILFSPGPIRVGEHRTTLGSPVGSGSEIYKATSQDRVVTGNIPLRDQSFANIGAPVEVMLPDGRFVPGHITEVGVPIQADPNSSRLSIPFAAELDNPEDTTGIQEADVSTIIPTEKHEDILYVPVSALVAINNTTFGVERINEKGEAETVPVKTGLFAKGFVQIEGEGLAEGQQVVTP